MPADSTLPVCAEASLDDPGDTPDLGRERADVRVETMLPARVKDDVRRYQRNVPVRVLWRPE